MHCLLNSSTQEITSGQYIGSNTGVITSAPTGISPGTYYIKVSAISGYAKDTQFSLTVNYDQSSNYEKEFNNSPNTANTLPLNTTFNGGFNSGGDEDWYKFNIGSEGKIIVSLSHSYRDNWDNIIHVHLLDSATQEIKSWSFKGDNTGIVENEVTNLNPGDYYFKVVPNYAGNNSDITYAINVRSSGSSAPDPTPTPSPSQPGSGAIYRLFNGTTGEHLYTPDANENAVLSQNGWKAEGVAWTAPANGTPVYRLFSSAAGEHLYTTDTNEVQTLTSGRGWTLDNNGNPLFYSGGSVSVYRLFNTTTGKHHLTTDLNEYNTLGRSGWKQEGATLQAVN